MIISKCNPSIKKNISSQKLSDYEMSRIENSDNNRNETDEAQKTKSHKEFDLNIVIYLYQVFIHIFIFSLFESVFFWLYITKEEDQAILNQIEDVVLVGDLFCTNINDDIDFTSLYRYQRDKRDNYNDNLPRNNTIMLNGYLFCTISLLNIILKVGGINITKLNYKTLKHQSATFLLLFVYEYIFFRNIVYNYVPNSSNKIIKKIFEKCV